MLAYIPYMDPMGKIIQSPVSGCLRTRDLLEISGDGLRWWSCIGLEKQRHLLAASVRPWGGRGSALGWFSLVHHMISPRNKPETLVTLVE